MRIISSLGLLGERQLAMGVLGRCCYMIITLLKAEQWGDYEVDVRSEAVLACTLALPLTSCRTGAKLPCLSFLLFTTEGIVVLTNRVSAGTKWLYMSFSELCSVRVSYRSHGHPILKSFLRRTGNVFAFTCYLEALTDFHLFLLWQKLHSKDVLKMNICNGPWHHRLCPRAGIIPLEGTRQGKLSTNHRFPAINSILSLWYRKGLCFHIICASSISSFP